MVASAIGFGVDVPIPTHPLGVKPLGNQYLSSGGGGGAIARRSIGSFEALPDEVLMLLLESFDGVVLRQLGSACRFLYACCHADELWKALFLR